MNGKPIAAGKSSYDLVDKTLLWPALALEAEMVMMDLGCGVGNYAVGAAAYIGPGGQIHALDAWSEGIETLRKRAGQLGLHQVRPVKADISRDLPIAPDSVDLCLLATVVHDLVQDERLASTMVAARKAMRNRGRLAVVEFKKITGPPGPPVDIRLSPQELDQALASHGYVRQKLDEVGPYHYLAQYRISAH